MLTKKIQKSITYLLSIVILCPLLALVYPAEQVHAGTLVSERELTVTQPTGGSGSSCKTSITAKTTASIPAFMYYIKYKGTNSVYRQVSFGGSNSVFQSAVNKCTAYIDSSIPMSIKQGFIKNKSQYLDTVNEHIDDAIYEYARLHFLEDINKAFATIDSDKYIYFTMGTTKYYVDYRGNFFSGSVPNFSVKLGTDQTVALFNQITNHTFAISLSAKNNCTDYSAIYVPGFSYNILSIPKASYKTSDGAIDGTKVRSYVYNWIKSNPSAISRVTYYDDRLLKQRISEMINIDSGGSSDQLYEGSTYNSCIAKYNATYSSIPYKVASDNDNTWFNVALGGSSGNWDPTASASTPGTPGYTWNNFIGSGADNCGVSLESWDVALAPTNTSPNINIIIGTEVWLKFNVTESTTDTYGKDCTSVTLYKCNSGSQYTSTNSAAWASSYGSSRPEVFFKQADPNGWGNLLGGKKASDYIKSTFTGVNANTEIQYGVFVLSPFMSVEGTPPPPTTISCYYNPSDPSQTGQYLSADAVPAGWVIDETGNACGRATSANNQDPHYVAVPWELNYPDGTKGTKVSAYAEIVANAIGGNYNASSKRFNTSGEQSGLTADWNVMEGIPSTENLSLASGGAAFQFALSGYDVSYGLGDGSAKGSVTTASGTSTAYEWINTGHLARAGSPDGPGEKLQSSYWNSLAVHRRILLSSHVDRVWGDNNTPCSLSCPGHTISGGTTWSWSSSASASASATGAGSTDQQEATMSGTDWTCPICGASFHQDDVTIKTKVCVGTTTTTVTEEETISTDNTESDSASVSASASHNCTWSFTFYCNTSTCETHSQMPSNSSSCSISAAGGSSGSGGSWTSPGDNANTNYNMTKTVNDSKQGWDISVTSGHGGESVSMNWHQPIIDLGYTYGTGCVHSNGFNMIHAKHASAYFAIYENIDNYSYVRLTNYTVDALTHNEITAVNPNILDTSYVGKKSSNIPLCTYVLLIGAQNASKSDEAKGYAESWDGHYENGNGRIIFTEIPLDQCERFDGWVPGDKSGASLYNKDNGYGGVMQTSARWYTMGDCYIPAVACMADHLTGDLPNPEYLDELPTTYNIHNRGEVDGMYAGTGVSKDGHTAPAACYGCDGATPREDWKSSNYFHYGDVMYDSEIKNQILQQINDWQYWANKGGFDGNGNYTAVVLSDGVAIGSAQYIEVSQQIVGQSYRIDDGVKLFSCGFNDCNWDYDNIHRSGDSGIKDIHYRYHRNNRYNGTTLRNEHDMSDVGSRGSPMFTGYSGLTETDLNIRYPDITDMLLANQRRSYFTSWDGSTDPNLIANYVYGIIRMKSGNVSGSDAIDHYSFTDPINGNSDPTGAKYIWGNGSYEMVSQGQEQPYANQLNNDSVSDVQHKTGYVLANTVLSGTTTPQQFTGYWDTYKYPYTGSYNIYRYVTGTNKGVIATVDEDGTRGYDRSYADANGSTRLLGTPLTISNLKLKWEAPNNVYSNPVSVRNVYTTLISQKTRTTMSTVAKGTANNQADSFIYQTWDKNVQPKSFDPKTGSLTHKDISTLAYNCTYYDDYVNAAGQTQVINDIIVHDPISVEYSMYITNNSGSYAPGVKDETNEDQRVGYKDIAEIDKGNYLVLGNTFHLWVSDFGDFYDDNGTPYDSGRRMDARGMGKTGDGANILTGENYSNNFGYMNKMNTGRWVQQRWVTFPFPVAYNHKNGTKVYCNSGEPINLANVMAIDSYGNQGVYYECTDRSGSTVTSIPDLFHSPSAALQNYASYRGEEVCYGLDYEFTILTSALESYSSKVEFWTTAINKPTSDNDKELDANTSRYSSKAYHIVNGYSQTEVVGRIGNLALEDTADFRFSNLFKQAESTWLIEGVIHDVDIIKPNMIVSTKLDIMGDDAYITKHNTLSATAYLIGSPTTTANFQYGKAGPFELLPLSPIYNPVTEYRNQCMRLGYMAYFDVETMGNYYGMNAESDGAIITRYQGPSNAQESQTRVWGSDGNGDSRWTNKVVIKPHYFLYDPDDGKFYGVNIYGGDTGNRSVVWSENLTITNPFELMIDLRSASGSIGGEVARRNVTNAEQFITNEIAKRSRSIPEDITVFEDVDYIGTADLIELDYHDKSFIGTSYYDGAVYKLDGSDLLKSYLEGVYGYSFIGPNTAYNPTGTVTSGRLEADSFSEQSQRWFFTVGLPSSAYVTYADNTIGKSQPNIEASHEKLMAEHPNGVVITFLEMEAHDDIWNLEYDARQQNSVDGTLTFKIPDLSDPSNPNPTPIDVTLPNSPITVTGDGQPDIDPTWIPVIVYDKQYNSTYDLSTYGTH